jgi:hypothetical protein
MTKYTVDFEYNIPEFSAIELEAETELDARQKAELIMEENYPEAVGLTIVKVTAV